MAHRIIEHLQNQHQELSLFLYSFRRQVKNFSDPFQNADIHLILEMLDFINLFPEQFHHPIEDQLFAHLLTKKIDERELVTQILNQHQNLESRTGTIREEFTALASTATSPLEDLVEDTLNYIDDQMEHLFHEEEEIFPLIEDSFDEQDWIIVEQKLESFEQGLEVDGFRSAIEKLMERISMLDTSAENLGMDPTLDTHWDR